MFYEEQGSGDPLLLIMGITAPGAVWEAHAEAWQANFRCILGDNRGVGQSDKPDGPYSSEMMADDYAGRVVVGKVNIDEARSLAEQYNIASIPTVLIFKGGQVAKQFMGVAPKEQFATALDEQLGQRGLVEQCRALPARSVLGR